MYALATPAMAMAEVMQAMGASTSMRRTITPCHGLSSGKEAEVERVRTAK
jgi:hypothetical protein